MYSGSQESEAWGRVQCQCPLPHAQCPMPHAQCPMPYAQCPMPHAPCPMPARAPHVTEKGYTLPALDRTATSQATDLVLKYGKSDRHHRQKPSGDGIDCTHTYCLCQRPSHDGR